jgi:hypothetical protein
MSQLTYYLIPIVGGLSAVLSFLFYAKTKKNGFVVIGAAFVIQVAYLIIFNVFLVDYFFLVNNDFAWRADLLSTISFAFEMIFAILLTVGLILLFNEIKPKTTPKLLDTQT